MVKAIEVHDKLCFKCLKSKDIKRFSITHRGYGSDFDNFNTYIQLCSECKIDGVEKWFNETPKIDEYVEVYQYEDNIHDFINTLPLEGRELFLNQCASGANSYVMDSQDWIDMELGVLPDEVYEEYGMYSPRQVKAYKERFPTCQHPINIIYKDGSKGCRCPFGAFGNYNQQTSDNIWGACYECPFYKERETPIKEMESDTYNKYEKYIKGMQYKDMFE